MPSDQACCNGDAVAVRDERGRGAEHRTARGLTPPVPGAAGSPRQARRAGTRAAQRRHLTILAAAGGGTSPAGRAGRVRQASAVICGSHVQYWHSEPRPGGLLVALHGLGADHRGLLDMLGHTTSLTVVV